MKALARHPSSRPAWPVLLAALAFGAVEALALARTRWADRLAAGSAARRALRR